MALDKQKILSELGSVVNQLQSADCGCMGKIFNNSNPHASNVAPTTGAGDHRHGCCNCQRFNHCNAPCNGDIRSNQTSRCNHSCMGQCNPTKLYNDTYQYLNQNLMQPVVKEVYNDLKSLTPANTVMSNQPNTLAASQGQTNLQVAHNTNIPYPDSSMNNVNRQDMHIDPRMGGNAIGGIRDQLGSTSGYINGPGNHFNVGGGQFNGAGDKVSTMNYNMSGTTSNVGGYMSAMGNQVSGGNGQMNAMESHINGMGGPVSESANHLAGTVNPMSGIGRQLGGTGSHMGGMSTYMNGVGGHTHEVGQNIVNMMMSGKKSNTIDNPNEVGKLTQPVVIDAPQSPHGQVGVIPLSANMNENGSNVAQMQSYNQHFNNNPGNPYNHMPVMNQNQIQNPNVDTNPLKQMAPKHKTYGQHTPGISKFNEMFPGVMQNFGEDLGFDPMTIAVQMNPANHQQAAIDTMSKIMNDNKADLNKIPNQYKPVQPINLTYSQPTDGVLTSNVGFNQPQQSNISGDHLSNQSPVINQQVIQNPYQQVYTTATPMPTIHQQQLQQPQHYNIQDQQLIQQQYIPTDPNINAGNTLTQQPNHVENTSKYVMQSQILNSPPIPEHVTGPESYDIVKDPIFPADASPNQTFPQIKQHVNYTYNTLGQPVEMLPAKRYHIKDSGGPQTLSPQNIPVNAKPNPKPYSNVKGTVSKTSIMGNQPLGRNPSKSQLQHIYQQYGGSQSLTHQNISSHGERPSNSEGRLNIPQQREGRVIHNNQVPVEKIGGDTLQNNDANDIKRPQPVSNQIGDVPDTKKISTNEVPRQTTLKKPKARNGLQDLVYTSYPTSTAWSFHGNARPSFVGRHRSRI